MEVEKICEKGHFGGWPFSLSSNSIPQASLPAFEDYEVITEKQYDPSFVDDGADERIIRWFIRPQDHQLLVVPFRHGCVVFVLYHDGEEALRIRGERPDMGGDRDRHYPPRFAETV